MSVGGGLRDNPQPPRDAKWKLTWYEALFFGALVALYIVLLFNNPLLALVLTGLFASYLGGIYTGWKGKGNYDMERYLGRWLT